MDRPDIAPALYARLVDRVDRIHLRQRLGIERVYEAKVFGQGRTFIHYENLEFLDHVIRGGLKAVGLYRRGQRNARAVIVRENRVRLPHLPAAFEGVRILQVTDLHLDLAPDIADALLAALAGLEFELCVLTGDFRAATFGPTEPCLEALARIRPALGETVLAVLGNHDSITMVPAIEDLGIRMLLNEFVRFERADAAVYIAGVDDPHYFRADNIEKASDAIPEEAVSILLSHSPEIYKNAAHAAFNFMLAGHTHGGQICLPGGWPVLLNADCRRRYCRGRWDYHGLQGYTSAGSGACVVDVRFNCPPEVVVHRLERGS